MTEAQKLLEKFKGTDIYKLSKEELEEYLKAVRMRKEELKKLK